VSEYIAVVNGNRDAELVSKYYSAAAGVRLPLERASKLIPSLPKGISLWVDGGIDALHRTTSMSPSYVKHIKGFDQGQALLQDGLAGNCSKTAIPRFVKSLLGSCVSLKPKWISIPQIPYDTAKPARRKKLNRRFIEATSEWQTANPQSGKYMLPVILYQADAANAKMKWRNDIIKYIEWARKNCHVDGIWVVNSALDDERGSQPNQDSRFPGIIALHEELRDSVPEGIRIVAGPYWAMNLVLWARRLVDNPVIGIATGYQYYVSGGETRAPADRVVILPLLRRVKVTDDLRAWLQKSEKTLAGVATPASTIGGMGSSFAQAASDFGTLSRQIGRLRGEVAHEHIAAFYRDWLERLEKIVPPMRALSLRQEFSEANVVGSILGDLPKGNQARQAGKLALQFMLSCL